MNTNKSYKSILERFKKAIRYVQGESVYEASKRTGISYSKIIQLNANENLFIPLELTLSIARKAIEEIDLRLYPTGLEEVYEKLSRYLGVKSECILLGFGSDQLIDLLIAMFGREGIVTIHPTYTYYPSRCELYNIPYRYVMLDENLKVNMNELYRLMEKSSLLILCNPNNPIGHTISEDFVRALAERFKGIVLIDEAYAEFSNVQLHKLTQELDNVIALRTFSKAFGAAGIRLGYLIGPVEIVKVVEKFQFPDPITSFSLKYASITLDMIDKFKAIWEEIKNVREWFYNKLSKIESIKVYPSQANFVSFGVQVDSDKLYDALLREGFLVRIFKDTLGFKSFARVTLAPRAILEQFLNSLNKILSTIS